MERHFVVEGASISLALTLLQIEKARDAFSFSFLIMRMWYSNHYLLTFLKVNPMKTRNRSKIWDRRHEASPSVDKYL